MALYMVQDTFFVQFIRAISDWNILWCIVLVDWVLTAYFWFLPDPCNKKIMLPIDKHCDGS